MGICARSTATSRSRWSSSPARWGVSSREEKRPARPSSSAAGSSHPPVSAPAGWQAPRSTKRPAQHLSTAAACFHCPPPTCYLPGAREKGTRGRKRARSPSFLTAAAMPTTPAARRQRRRHRCSCSLLGSTACYRGAPSSRAELVCSVAACTSHVDDVALLLGGARHPEKATRGWSGGPPATEERAGGHYFWRDGTPQRFAVAPTAPSCCGFGDRARRNELLICFGHVRPFS